MKLVGREFYLIKVTLDFKRILLSAKFEMASESISLPEQVLRDISGEGIENMPDIQ